MARSKKKPAVEPNKLLETMQFLSLVQEASGSEPETFCILSQHTAVAFNGILAAGQRIDEDLEACPQTFQMTVALSRCGPTYAITQLSPDRLCVRSGDFEAFVPCLNRERLPAAIPDAAFVPISDSLTGALKILLPLVSEKAERIAAAAIQVRSKSAVATNLEVIIEAWHGYELPGALLIPKAAAQAILKSGRKLASIGASEKTATFWFEDGSWIRTQLYKEQYPDVSSILDAANAPVPIAENFFACVKAVAPFSISGNVYCGNGYIRSHPKGYAQEGSGRYDAPIDGELQPRIYGIKALKLIEKHAELMDATPLKWSLFFGKNLRGAIVHTVYNETVADLGDDIPF